MNQAPEVIILAIVEFFHQKEFATINSISRLYHNMMKRAKLQKCQFDAKWLTPKSQIMAKHLDINVDNGNEILFHMLQHAKGLESIHIRSTRPVIMSNHFGEKITIPPVVGLIKFSITCPQLDIESLPSSLLYFEATALVREITPEDLKWPQLRSYQIHKHEDLRLSDIPKLQHLKCLEHFKFPFHIPKASYVLPNTVVVLDAPIAEIDIKMPNLTRLICSRLPQGISNCPNLKFWKGCCRLGDISSLTTVEMICPYIIDYEVLEKLCDLPKLTKVCNCINSMLVSYRVFHSYLPHCELYDDGNLIKK